MSWHFFDIGWRKEQPRWRAFILSVRRRSSVDCSESLKPSVCRCYLRSACWNVLGKRSEVVSGSQTSLVLSHNPCNWVSAVGSALVAGWCLLPHAVDLAMQLLHNTRSSLHRNALRIFEPRVLFQCKICACFVLWGICKRIWIILSLWSHVLSLSVARNNLLAKVLLTLLPIVVKVPTAGPLHCIAFGFLWQSFLFLRDDLLQFRCTAFLLDYPVEFTISFVLVLGH